MMVRRLQLTQHFTHRPPSGAVLSQICKDEESGTSPMAVANAAQSPALALLAAPRDPFGNGAVRGTGDGASAGIVPGDGPG